MSNLALFPLLIATWQTIYMVFISSVVSIGFGLFLGALLFVSTKNHSLENDWIHYPLLLSEHDVLYHSLF